MYSVLGKRTIFLFFILFACIVVVALTFFFFFYFFFFFELAWLCKIELSSEDEIQDLFSEAAYKKFCEESH